MVIHVSVDFCSGEIEFIPIFGHIGTLCGGSLESKGDVVIILGFSGNSMDYNVCPIAGCTDELHVGMLVSDHCSDGLFVVVFEGGN